MVQTIFSLMGMKISVGKQTEERSEGARAVVWSEFAVFLAGCWIAGALVSSPLLGTHWLLPGDFKYSTAMYYHGIMALGLIGEFLWFLTLGQSTFLAGMIVMGIALVVGAKSLWPYATITIPGGNL